MRFLRGFITVVGIAIRVCKFKLKILKKIRIVVQFKLPKTVSLKQLVRRQSR